ncbi:hypothetical protein [Desulfotomaculum nigrificans]|uniref:hypothetical protein n=1 Tax=Desulfotomaculum nigrificans TaxID=1565 RepID=UPI001FA6EC65|nr:hypothetical protein [Desulfotomaculum nigrificans]
MLPGIRKGSFDWVAFYGKVALTGERQEFCQYAEPLQRWYKITAFSPEKGKLPPGGSHHPLGRGRICHFAVPDRYESSGRNCQED